MNDVETTEQRIAQYRKELSAEAELADGDLAEIEDHLRTLTDDLRSAGMPAAEAVTEAARRLGDPKHLAREHARVRSPFGAKLSRARAWSAALLFGAPLAWFLFHYHDMNRFTFETVAGLVVALGLLTRLSWARPIALGGMAFFLFPTLYMTVRFNISPAWIVWHVGVLAFLIPWRRGELTGVGWSLALCVWSYGAASIALMYRFTDATGDISIITPAAVVALLSSTIAVIGGVLRARWSVLAALLSSVALWGVAANAVLLQVKMSFPVLTMTYLLTLMITGALAASIATVIAARTARSTLGTLRYVLR